MRAAPQKPSVGPALLTDPATESPQGMPELLPSPVEPAIFQASRTVAPGQPLNGQVNSASNQQTSGSGRSQAIPQDYAKPAGTPSYSSGAR